MINIYLKTKSEAPHKGEYIEVCTCRDDENVIRKIVQGYEDIWQSTINRPVDTPAEEHGSSTDPIILNWGGSEILVEDTETKESEYFNL
ncbi:MAG TPA: hypothetical protein DCS66_24360 [Flavobacteriaceae bacterium]|nr:hypothetical protein [Flavobacteriaceae bacterium]